MTDDNVVIFGCPRSGTSILGELFEVIPDFNYYFEPGMPSIRARPLSGGERWAFKNPVDLMDGDREKAIEHRSRGLTCNLEELISLVKPVKFIWIVRHPLDTVCSLIPGLSDGWNHAPEPPIWEPLMRLTPVERAAHQWRWVNEAGFASLEPFKPLIVHYEDLVGDTVPTVEDILDFVNAEPDEFSLARYVRQVSNKPGLLGGYEAKHQDRWVRGKHETHIGRWKSELSNDEILRALTIVNDIAMEFGYEASR